MKKSLLSIMMVAAVAGGCFTVSTASGDMIFSTVGSETSYAAAGEWWTVFSDSSPLHSSWAIAFTPADNYSLTSIEIGLAWNEEENGADVWLMSDNGDQPGSIIESFEIDLDTSGSADSTMSLLQLDSEQHSILEAGTQYWVSASVSTASSWAFWVLTGPTPVDYTWGTARIGQSVRFW